MTSHCGDSNIWFRVCSCQNSNRTNHAPQKRTKISRYPHHDEGINVWCQQVTSSAIPQSILNKRHNMSSYHRVREAIAAKILEFHWCSSDQNRSDILTYHRVREAIAVKILEFHWCSSDQNRSDILSKHWEHAEGKDTIRELFEYLLR